MEAKCKTCETKKDISKMRHQAYPIKDFNNKIIYGANQYWYFCNENCVLNYNEF